MQFLFVTVVPKYFNFAPLNTTSRNLRWTFKTETDEEQFTANYRAVYSCLPVTKMDQSDWCHRIMH